MRFLSTPTRRIVAMNFFSMLAFQSTYFVGVIGCATYVLGLGALEVSALVFLLNVVLVAGNLASGPVIDTIGPRRTLIAVLSATSVLGAVAWLAPVSYPELVLVAMALGLSFGMSTTAIDAYPRYFSEDAGELARMNSLNQVATGASVVFGPAMAGWITTWAPVQCVFSLLMLAPLPAAALAWATREELTAARSTADAADAERPAGGLRGFLSNAAEGVRIVFGREDLRVLFFIGFLGFFAYGAFDSLESLFYRDVLRVGADWMGWLSAVSGVGGGVGSMIYTGTPFVVVAAVGQVVTGIGFGALAPVRTTLMQQRCEPGNVGRVSSIMRMGMNSAGTLPLLVSPALAAAFGPQAVLFGASTLAALIGLTFALGAHDGKKGAGRSA